jgi:hypothetical protein
MFKTKIQVLLIACLLGFFSLSKTAFANPGSASFSVTGGGSYATGSTISSAVYINSPTDPVNVVEADLIYNQSQLQFLGADTSQSSFSNDVSSTGGNGSIKIIRYTFTPVTGQGLVATLSFKVLVDSGSGSLNFSPGSHIISNGQDVWDKNTAGTAYTFTPPPVEATAPPAPAPQPTQTSPQPATADTKPVVDSAWATTTKLPSKSTHRHPYPDTSSRKWWIFIGLCSLTILGLFTRLFNLHKKIRAKTFPALVSKALKKAV